MRALESSENTWPGKILVMATACVLTTQVAALVTVTAVRTLLSLWSINLGNLQDS